MRKYSIHVQVAPLPRLRLILLCSLAAGGAQGLRMTIPAGGAAFVVTPRTPRSHSTMLVPSTTSTRPGMSLYHRRRFGEKIHDARWRLRGKLTSDDDHPDVDTSRPVVVVVGDEVAREDEEPSSTSSTSSLGEILVLVLPLLLIYVSNQWSRYSISYLVDFSSPATDATTPSAASAYEAMNVDLHFTQSQYGLLASAAFTALFALSSLLAGTLADRYDRKMLVLVPASVWVVATLCTGQSRSYDDVLIARVVMGGACAFVVPAAYSLIADGVSRDRLALSNSLFGSGVYLGGALASLSLLLDRGLGWRGTLTAIGGFGAVAITAAGLLLPSDGDRNGKNEHEMKEGSAFPDSTKRIESEGDDDGPIRNTIRILSIPRVRFIFLASFFRFCSGLLIGVWAAPYYKQTFPDSVSEYAVLNALITGAVGMSSGILGGYIADRLGTWFEETTAGEGESTTSIIRDYFDEQTIRLLLPISGSLLAIPAWYLTTHTTSSTNAFEIAMTWLAIEYLVAECWFGPTIAVLQSIVGASRTGTAQGLFVLTGALGNSAPTLLGWIYGNQITGESSSSSEILANLLAWGVCSGYLLSSIFFALSVRASGESLMNLNNKEK
ncbi:hypothetical protein ACHAW5_010491 [Stephanodiscus triporus]|uniref:Major facilitator superfamily (MFS) profile domain-containing protein n=1 Tax=Stephanodiscus triporus TaxID=2934178 RepID=A0ABD3N485_9STRA